jgi:hypothetical protein
MMPVARRGLAFLESGGRAIICPPEMRKRGTMRPIKRGFRLLFLLLAVAGCSVSDGGEPLLEDRFEEPANGWGSEEHETFGSGYADGDYFIEVTEPDWFAWSHPRPSFEDVRVEAEARLVGGSRDNHFGLICRYRNDENFYYLAISSDGYHAIFRRVDGGDLEFLSREAGMVRSPAIDTAEGGVNHLVAICEGQEISLFVNDEHLETVIDETLPRGGVGLGVGSGPTSGDEGGVRVHFDNFLVTQPSTIPDR